MANADEVAWFFELYEPTPTIRDTVYIFDGNTFDFDICCSQYRFPNQ